MATIDDVARKAGVSVATVSRVLNNSGYVKATTVDKVRRAISELEYVPNMAARNLRKNESMAVMILAPNFTNPYYSHILAAIGDSAQIMGYSVFICNSGNENSVRDFIDESIKRRRADGIIMLSNSYDAKWLSDYANALPIVQCCEYAEDVKLPHVAIDNYAATFEAVEYLISLGHRRIATISSTNSHISTKLRYKGYCDALTKAGIELREDYSVYAAPNYSFSSGYIAANKLLNLTERPSAIFCISDILALSAIAAVGDRGLNSPSDVSIMGFDDVDYTTMFHPYLTTITQPCYELGRKAMQVLHDFKSDFPSPPALGFLPHELTIRESTAPFILHE